MKKSTPIIVSVTGWSGSGKTTFCEGLIAEIASRGFRVSAAKNSHQDLTVDKPGSDSYRFFNSGAESVCLNAKHSMTLFRHQNIAEADELKILFKDSDFIIAEGFKAADSIRIEVTGISKDAGEMKNPAIEADVIIYGNTNLIENIGKEIGSQTSNIQFIHRNDIRTAAEYITDMLT
jgi:molybdopterin-guanine dinucleotide biosynthesis protein MobB